jgi:glycosyltransferase involved in cell wall biosynthesis
MNSHTLTVAIPTYNRFALLCKSISRLIPKLTDEVGLLVIDNASTDETVNLRTWIRENFPDARIQVVRNNANIGASANVARCIEYCETEWVWTLGDDDDVSEDAIAKVLQCIKNNPSATHINMQSTLIPLDSRRQAGTDVLIESTIDLGEKLDFMTNFLLCSAGVHRTDVAHAVLSKAYSSLSSAAPQLAIVFASLELGIGKVVLCGDTVITHKFAEGQRWGSEVWLAVADVFTLIRDQQVRGKLLSMYINEHWTPVNTNELRAELLPLLLQGLTRSMSLSDYLYLWSKRIQFSRRPGLLLAKFLVDTLVLALAMCVSPILTKAYSPKLGPTNTFLRTRLDGRGA